MLRYVVHAVRPHKRRRQMKRIVIARSSRDARGCRMVCERDLFLAWRSFNAIPFLPVTNYVSGPSTCVGSLYPRVYCPILQNHRITACDSYRSRPPLRSLRPSPDHNRYSAPSTPPCSKNTLAMLRPFQFAWAQPIIAASCPHCPLHLYQPRCAPAGPVALAPAHISHD